MLKHMKYFKYEHLIYEHIWQVFSDRNKLCYKCGNKDHKTIDFIDHGECMTCPEQNTITNHVPGFNRCRAFKDALKIAERRLR